METEKINMWEHYCAAERCWIFVDENKPCNWCNTSEQVSGATLSYLASAEKTLFDEMVKRIGMKVQYIANRSA